MKRLFSTTILSPLVHLSNNWLSLAGVVIVTTATVFWLFLLPVTLRGQITHPYIGILVFLLLPVVLLTGLALVPLGIMLRRRRELRLSVYPADFPALTWSNLDFRRLALFMAITTFVNIVVASQLTYGAVQYMDSVTFCGDILRIDLPQRDATGVHRTPELGSCAGGLRGLSHRPWGIVVRPE
jgi:hypothetical protein